VLALVTTPGKPHTTALMEAPPPRPRESQVLLRALEVGVCGTDREISEGVFGEAPPDREQLILGHELLAVVHRDGQGFARGELVTATVRRSCGHCVACAEGAPDACLTGDYAERGITRMDGFASELIAEDPEHLVAIPTALGRLGVLAEPASVCARALRHTRVIGERQPWQPRRALVLGAGAIGMLSTCLLALEGLELWTASRERATSHKADLARALGARYVCTLETPAATVAADVGGFDIVVAAVGDAQVLAEATGLLARSGVACLLGIDGRPHQVTIEGRLLAVDLVLGNRVLFGSVNANRIDWVQAVRALAQAHERWPEVLSAFVGLRTPADRFEEAFAFDGVKATLTF
jgi:threonine dehydrogenase-like Zn-dependent dehydrogenase